MPQPVGQGEQAVCEMHIFDEDRGVFKMEIAVTEIPERTDAECGKPRGNLRSRRFRHTDDCKLRMLLMTEAGQRIRMVYGHTLNRAADSADEYRRLCIFGMYGYLTHCDRQERYYDGRFGVPILAVVTAYRNA